jgi:chorismate mutase/prephenate dehydratase
VNEADKIAAIRTRIDAIDDEINQLLAKRAICGVEMKRVKGGVKIYRPAREAAILQRMVTQNTSMFSDDSIRAIFTEIISSGRNLEEKLRVSYLGPAGSYSHEAAQKLLGATSNFVPEATLRDALKAAESGSSEVALLPIENSSEGSVTETHKLLLSTALSIIGEVRLPIQHNLLSSAKTLDDIKVVYGHPQALGQCREWLRTHVSQAELVPASSNSQAAQQAANEPTSAAIASKKAADIVGLPVIAKAISDNVSNETRFVLLGKAATEPTDSDKTSVICTTTDKPGALHELLGIFVANGINLLRLESQPHPDHQYAFYIDFEGHKDTANVAKALEALNNTAKSCKLLGSYPKGN